MCFSIRLHISLRTSLYIRFSLSISTVLSHSCSCSILICRRRGAVDVVVDVLRALSLFPVMLRNRLNVSLSCRCCLGCVVRMCRGVRAELMCFVLI